MNFEVSRENFFNQHLFLQMVGQGHHQGVPQQRLSTYSRPKVL